jgi:Spy/CpxP family protein refolding chaperone
MRNVLIRIVAVSAVTALFATASFSQINVVAGVPAGNGPIQDPFAGLKKALSLTDSQASQLESLIQSQMASLQPLFSDLMAKEDALQTALQGGNATAIGNAMLEVQSAQKALKTAQDANRDALMAVLTAAQKQIVNDYLLIAQNGGLGPLGIGIDGPIAFRPGAGFFHVTGHSHLVQ